MDETPTRTAEPLDLRGLKCPLPVLRTRRALLHREAGSVLTVLCTDPLAGLDIPNLVREMGDALLEAERDGDGWRFAIRKARGRSPGEDGRTGSNAESPR